MGDVHSLADRRLGNRKEFKLVTQASCDGARDAGDCWVRTTTPSFKRIPQEFAESTFHSQGYTHEHHYESYVNEYVGYHDFELSFRPHFRSKLKLSGLLVATSRALFPADPSER